VARAAGARVIGIHARPGGRGRGPRKNEGTTAADSRLRSGRPSGWPRPTPNTLVPPDWLRRQLDYANGGLGPSSSATVTVTDWDGPSAARTGPRSPNATLSAPGGTLMCTGANLGIRASAYLAAGGFPPLRTAEGPTRLLAAATRSGCMVAQASDIAVETSGPPAGARAAPADSATCCGRWLTSGVPAGNTPSDAVRP